MFTLLQNPKLKAYLNICRWTLYNKLGKLTYPSMAHYFITYKCNLRCKNCNIWKLNKKELSMEEIRMLINKLTFLDIIKVTGGEPFLRDDLIEIIDLIKKNINPYILRITTNGTNTENIVSLIKKLGYPNLQLRISLDGWGKIHDKIRGQHGVFDKVMDTLTVLIQLRKKYKISLGINFGVRNINLDSFDIARHFCKKNNIDFIPGVPIKPFIFERNRIQDIDKSASEVVERKGTQILAQSIKDYIGLERYILRILGEKSLMKGFKKTPIYNFKCQELSSLMYILPNGDLVKCGIRKEKIDNLIDSDFDDIWFSENINIHRKKVRNCKGCLQTSIEILSRIYTGNLI